MIVQLKNPPKTKQKEIEPHGYMVGNPRLHNKCTVNVCLMQKKSKIQYLKG